MGSVNEAVGQRGTPWGSWALEVVGEQSRQWGQCRRSVAKALIFVLPQCLNEGVRHASEISGQLLSDVTGVPCPLMRREMPLKSQEGGSTAGSTVRLKPFSHSELGTH